MKPTAIDTLGVTEADEKPPGFSRALARRLAHLSTILLAAFLMSACVRLEVRRAVIAVRDASVSMAQVQAVARSILPAEFRALEIEQADMQKKFDAKDYDAATRAGRELHEKAEALKIRVQSEIDRLMKRWNELLNPLPKRIAELTDAANRLAAEGNAPKIADRERLETIRRDLDQLAGEWKVAKDAMDAADLVRAVDLANDIAARVERLEKELASTRRRSGTS